MIRKLSIPARATILLMTYAAPLVALAVDFAKLPEGTTVRVLRGRAGSTDFEHLSPNLERKIIMLTDARGFASISDADGYQVLREIGYPESDIAKYLQDGVSFRVAVLPPQDGVLPATWDNLIRMIRSTYPDLVQKISAQLATLKKHSGPEGYQKIMASAPAKEMATKMTAERLQKSRGTLWEVRKFLHDQLNLNELYMGDGYTYSLDPSTKRPKRGIQEYFAINKPLKELKSVQLQELPVSIP